MYLNGLSSTCEHQKTSGSDSSCSSPLSKFRPSLLQDGSTYFSLFASSGYIRTIGSWANYFDCSIVCISSSPRFVLLLTIDVCIFLHIPLMSLSDLIKKTSVTWPIYVAKICFLYVELQCKVQQKANLPYRPGIETHTMVNVQTEP